MIRIRSTALPAAVTVLLLVGACQDAPSGPQSPARPAIIRAPEANSPGVQIYSGRRADSVATAILTAWSLHGHPEYLAERKASLRNLHLAALAAGRLAAGNTPAQFLLADDGSTGVYKDPPQIFDHHENFYFGNSSGIQSLLDASMSFVGDRGRIFANVTVTGTGPTVAQSQTLADGGGVPINCSDVVFGICSSRFLQGSMVLSSAPHCDAHATGSATYTAQNTDVTVGSVAPLSPTSGGYSGLPATTVAPIDATSGACTDDNGTVAGSGGSTGGSSGADGSGGNPAPTWPAPQPSAPADQPPPPLSFHCETVQWYYGGVIDSEYAYCYAD